MIHIDGQLCASFTIGDGRYMKEDFIEPNNIKSFTIYTHAGNIRPTIELSFILEDASIINYLNAGNNLKVSFGVDELTKDQITFQLISDDTKVHPGDGYKITLVGVMTMPKFTSTIKSQYFKQMTSLNVMKQIISSSTSLKFKTNVIRTNDLQDWYQGGETDWEYLEEVWMHSFIDDSTFTMMGFDPYNFYFYDARKLISSTPKWLFTPNSLSSGRLINYNDYDTQNEYGSVAPLVGQNLITDVFNIDTGESTTSSYSLKNFTVQGTNKLNLNQTNCQNFDYSFINGNFHKNYIKAYNQNVRNNLMFSTFSTYLTTNLPFNSLSLLDTAEIETINDDERIKGTHIISGLNYQYQDGVLWTNVTLNKESPSNIRGSDLT